jgi:hypothetical protein
LDNASTDGTVQWIESLNDQRIVIYKSETSLTIENNWARIKDIPKNEFMTLIGHDDMLDPDYLAVMDALIQKHPQASLYQAHFRYIDKDGVFKRSCLPMEEVQYVHEFIACQLMHTMDSMGTGYMMRSRDYDAVGGIADYPNLIFGDYEMFVQLIAKSYKATALAECFSYREHVSTSTATNGEVYQQAFGRYISFLTELRQTDEKIKQVIDRYGKRYLLYFCESLSHRLLKTRSAAKEISVADFINKCKTLAAVLIPGQAFEPEKKMRINLAKKLDATAMGRFVFDLYKKMMG